VVGDDPVTRAARRTGAFPNPETTAPVHHGRSFVRLSDLPSLRVPFGGPGCPPSAESRRAARSRSTATWAGSSPRVAWQHVSRARRENAPERAARTASCRSGSIGVEGKLNWPTAPACRAIDAARRGPTRYRPGCAKDSCSRTCGGLWAVLLDRALSSISISGSCPRSSYAEGDRWGRRSSGRGEHNSRRVWARKRVGSVGFDVNELRTQVQHACNHARPSDPCSARESAPLHLGPTIDEKSRRQVSIPFFFSLAIRRAPGADVDPMSRHKRLRASVVEEPGGPDRERNTPSSLSRANPRSRRSGAQIRVRV